MEMAFAPLGVMSNWAAGAIGIGLYTAVAFVGANVDSTVDTVSVIINTTSVAPGCMHNIACITLSIEINPTFRGGASIKIDHITSAAGAYMIGGGFYF